MAPLMAADIAGFHVGDDPLPRRGQGNQVATHVAVHAQRQIQEWLSPSHAGAKTRQGLPQPGSVGGKPFGAFTGDLDGAGDDRVGGQRGEHLWASRLALREPHPGQFLHRQVDLRCRHIAFPAQCRGVGDPTKHERRQGASFVHGQPERLEGLQIRQSHPDIIYSP